MSPKRLNKYVDECSVRQNVRQWDTMNQVDSTIRALFGKRLRYEELVDGPDDRLQRLRSVKKRIEMAKLHRKPVPSAEVPPMSEFEIDEVVSILLGVKPRPKQKSRKQKFLNISNKLD